MITTETISNKISRLPASSRRIVVELIDDLLRKESESNRENPADAWADWAASHSGGAVILDDSREAIYQD